MPSLSRSTASTLYPRYFAEFQKLLPSKPPFVTTIARKPRDNDIGWKCFGEPTINLYAAATFQKGAIMAGLMAPSLKSQIRFDLLRSKSGMAIDRELFERIREK